MSTPTTPARTEARRYNTKKCSACRTVTSVLATRVENRQFDNHGWCYAFALADGSVARGENGGLAVACRGCGKEVVATRVIGRVVVDKLCDGRCESATGHDCECSCGGKNHGASHGVAA